MTQCPINQHKPAPTQRCISTFCFIFCHSDSLSCVWVCGCSSCLLFTSFFTAFAALPPLLLDPNGQEKKHQRCRGTDAAPACNAAAENGKNLERRGVKLFCMCFKQVERLQQFFLSGWSHDQKHNFSHLVYKVLFFSAFTFFPSINKYHPPYFCNKWNESTISKIRLLKHSVSTFSCFCSLQQSTSHHSLWEQ